MYGLSAAHKTLPLGTQVRVTNLENRRSVVLVINDRGPFVSGRILDLSYGAAKKLDTVERGVARVRIEAVGTVPLCPVRQFGSSFRGEALPCSRRGFFRSAPMPSVHTVVL
ncbi:septal ring lytic transglycosylase RlpA family protein [uncultured Pseudodesulfovibrio sp.]|uniref:septal ring lytic transglycosylase RlpA family protein n=1 Tax=uncultured Pseudodesulfovibrio sp. TaxID=2035858 RepID=UPI0029C79A23|nr:septal ring lytic transglycosylase RlpA family protein [uncultured Pseudodesulfovibrio sp.]